MRKQCIPGRLSQRPGIKATMTTNLHMQLVADFMHGIINIHIYRRRLLVPQPNSDLLQPAVVSFLVQQIFSLK